MNYKVIIVLIVAAVAYYLYNAKKKKDQAEKESDVKRPYAFPVIPEGVTVVENPTLHEEYIAPSEVSPIVITPSNPLVQPSAGTTWTQR